MTIHIRHFHVLSPGCTRCVSVALDLPPKGEAGTAVASFEFYNSTHESMPFSRKRAAEGVRNRLVRAKKIVNVEIDGQPHPVREYMLMALKNATDIYDLLSDEQRFGTPNWFAQALNSGRLVPGTPGNKYTEAIRYAIWRARKTNIPLDVLDRVIRQACPPRLKSTI
jgi:hypothetical protein